MMPFQVVSSLREPFFECSQQFLLTARPAKHQVKHFARPAEKAAVIGGRIVVQIFVETVFAIGENKLGSPTLVTVDFQTGRADERDDLAEIVKRVKVVFQIGN